MRWAPSGWGRPVGIWFITALNALLPALTGAWKDTGGGVQLSTSQAFHLNRASLERLDLQPRPTRLINMSQLGGALNRLQDPPVKALVVYNSNPAAIAPDQNAVITGLRREDLFTVVMEQFMTGTAAHADIVLPATTFLEHADLYIAYGHYYLQLARPALAPPGECRSNWSVFSELAQRMGTTQSVISRLEEGGGARNRLDTLARVATALDRHLVVSFPVEVPTDLTDAIQVA